MAKQKFPIQWILAFALTPVVIIAFVLFMLFGGGSEKASQQTHADVEVHVALRGIRPGSGRPASRAN